MFTAEKRKEILKRLKVPGISVQELCERAGVRRSQFYAVLRNESSALEAVEAVIAQAEKEKAEIDNRINSL